METPSSLPVREACPTSHPHAPVTVGEEPHMYEHVLPAPYLSTSLTSYGLTYPEYGQPYRINPHDDSLKSRAMTGNAHCMLASEVSQASASSEHNPPQLYRKFAELNHRIALHLQSEIAQLEKELKRLDKRLETNPDECRELEFHRTDTLGRIFAKINQYSESPRCLRNSSIVNIMESADQTLTSFDNLDRVSKDASGADIKSYRALVSQRPGIPSRELGFLDSRSDLVSLASREPVDSRANRSLIFGPPAAILLAFLAFSGLPGLISRFILLILLSTVGYSVLYQPGEGLGSSLSPQERRVCFILYLGVLVVMAGTIK